jgi:hypothetical protein
VSLKHVRPIRPTAAEAAAFDRAASFGKRQSLSLIRIFAIDCC